MIKTHKKNGKSIAKSYGLKSVFAKDDNLLIAVNGKKSELVVEQIIDKTTSEKIKEKKDLKFIAKSNEKVINLKPTSGNTTTSVNNPYYFKNNEIKKIGQDYLGIKEKLENEFFGNTFSDNIHIQIAYKIFDIKKIIAKHVSNVLYSLNNVQHRPVDIEPNDVVGTLSCYDKFSSLKPNFLEDDKKLIDVLLDYSRYYDYVFKKQKNDVTDEESIQKLKELKIGDKPKKFHLICRVKNIDKKNTVTFDVGGERLEYRDINPKYKIADKIDITCLITKIFDRSNPNEPVEKYLISPGASIKECKTGYANDTYEYNYDLLRLVSFFRQSSFHYDAKFKDALFNIDSNPEINDILSIGNKTFENSMKMFNQKYNDNCEKNIFMIAYILFDGNISLVEEADKQQIYKDYYHYVLRKENRNIGFNLRKIRNYLFDHYIQTDEVNVKILNNEKKKVNTLLDYFIYKYYNEHPEIVEEIVNSLRELRVEQSKEEEAKELIYKKEANKFIDNNKVLFKKIVSCVKKYISDDSEINNFLSSNCSIEETIDVCSFAKLLYVITKFLDVKEANDLLTSLITTFQNISNLTLALVDPVNYEDYVVKKQFAIYKNNYELLNSIEANELANQLILVKNLANMKNQLQKSDPKNDSDKLSAILYKDAFNTFRDTEITDEEYESIMTDFNTNKKNKGKEQKAGTPGSKLRNFFINNVINSRRFYYIVKYYDTRKCRAIIQNTNILKYILNREDMPLDQLKRYYLSVFNEEKENRNEMVNDLITELQKLTFDAIANKAKVEFEKEIQSFDANKKNKDINIEIEKLKSLVSLYLTICYWIVKGFVNVNSICILGFAAFERDLYYLKDIEYEKEIKKNQVDFLTLLNDFKERDCFKKRHKEIDTNIKEANDNLFDVFLYKNIRNKICHLNVCYNFTDYASTIGHFNSYYDLYMYCLEMNLANTFKMKGIEHSYLVNVRRMNLENKKYNRDALKLIFLPFAYNMARYKNLTIADLFNDKYNEKLDKDE